MKILFVEDDHSIALGLAFKALESEAFDLCLLDVTLPDGSGYEICKRAKRREDTAVIFLTACDDEGNVVMGLDMGADDYIVKPFRIRELFSRMKSVLRRYRKGEQAPGLIEAGGVSIDPLAAKVYRDGQELSLTAMEYRLLLTLAREKGRVLSRSQLLEGLWDIGGEYVNDNTLTVYIKRLREKLGQDQIRTVRGLGYRLGE